MSGRRIGGGGLASFMRALAWAKRKRMLEDARIRHIPFGRTQSAKQSNQSGSRVNIPKQNQNSVMPRMNHVRQSIMNRTSSGTNVLSVSISIGAGSVDLSRDGGCDENAGGGWSGRRGEI